jgi:hypothetical protein
MKNASNIRRAARFAILLVMVLGAFGATRAAQAAETLRWRFTAGTAVRYEMTNEMKQSMALAGASTEVSSRQIIDMLWKIESVDDQGTAVMSQIIERMRVKISTLQGPQKIEAEFDSSNAAASANNPIAQSLGQVSKAMIGKPVTMKVSATGKLSDIVIPPDMIEGLKAAPGVGAMFSEDYIKQLSSQSMLQLPEEPVDTGASWTSETKADNPLLGQQTVVGTYVFEGVRERDGQTFANISSKVEQQFQPAADSQVQVEVKEQSSAGKIEFNLDSGSLDTSKMLAQMKLHIKAMGTEIDQDITLNMSLRKMDGAKTVLPQ